MASWRAYAGVLLSVAACAVQEDPPPDSNGPDTGDSGASGSVTAAGKNAGGTTSMSGSGGKASAGYGGDFEDQEGGSGGKAGAGGAMSGGSATGGMSGTGTGGAGGKGGAGGNSTAGAGGKGGNAGSSGASGSAGTTSGGTTSGGTASGGTGGAGNPCTPTNSAPIPGISARYQAEGNDAFAVAGKLIIANTGQSTLNLADLKLRYYFTNEVTATLQKTVNWAYYRPNGGGAQQDRSGKVSFDVVLMTCNANNADTYLEFKFTADAGLLEPGHQIYFSWAAHNTASQTFTKTNDYSFDASAQEGSDYQRVVVLQNSGNRVWGTEP